MSREKNPYLHYESREKPVSYVCVMYVPYTLVRTIHVSNGAASNSSYSHRSAAESWTDKEGCTTLLYTVSCVAVAASPTRRSLLTETANSEQQLVAAVLHVVVSSRTGRTALF